MLALGADLVYASDKEKKGHLRKMADLTFPLLLSVTKCTPDQPCLECQGDCNSDADCAGDLVCWQKYGSATVSLEAFVPCKNKKSKLFFDLQFERTQHS